MCYVLFITRTLRIVYSSYLLGLLNKISTGPKSIAAVNNYEKHWIADQMVYGVLTCCITSCLAENNN